MHLLTWNYCILAGVLMVSPFVISAPNTGGSHPVAIICFFLLVFSSVVLTRDNNSLKKRKTVLGLAYFLVAAILLLSSIKENTGLCGIYYGNSAFEGVPESSWRFSEDRVQCTRIDEGVNFTNRGFSLMGQVFPLYFANDWNRFNYYGSNLDEKRREQFAFSANWTGFIHVNDFDKTLQLQASDGVAELEVDGRVLTINESGATASLNIQRGIYPLSLSYSSDEGTNRELRLSWVSPENELIPLSKWETTLTSESTTGNFDFLLKLLFITWVLLFAYHLVNERERIPWKEIKKEELVLWSIFLLLIVAQLIYLVVRGESQDIEILSGGNDHLLYETQARNVLGGDFLDSNSTLNAPFSLNVGYRYLLAFSHLFMGEGVTLIRWVQTALMYGFLMLAYTSIKRLYSSAIAKITIIQLFILNYLTEFSEQLLDTAWNIFFSITAIYFLIRWARNPSTKFLLIGATLLALACFVRTNYLPLILLSLGWVVYISRHHGQGPVLNSSLVAGICALPYMLIGLRNKLVSGDWVFLPTSGGYNFWLGNREISEGVDFFDGSQVANLTDTPTAEAITYILNEPILFLARCWEKILFVLGYDNFDLELELGIFVPSVLAIIALAIAKRTKVPIPEFIFIFLWICCVIAPLIVIFPWGYGWRLQAGAMLLTNFMASYSILAGYYLTRRVLQTY